MKDVFSIVVPVYNREKLLLRCLDSAFSQTYRPLHLIVVDNGSTDNSYECAVRWGKNHESPDFRVTVVKEETPGAPAARNRGLQLVESEYMCFFDSDDEMRPSLAENSMRGFKENPDTDVVCRKVLYHDLDGKTRAMDFTDREFLQEHILRAVLRTQGYAVRTSFMKEIGGWDSEILYWNDWELGMRLLTRRGVKVVAIDSIDADVFAQAASITGTEYGNKCGKIKQALAAAGKDMGCQPEYYHRLLRLVGARVAARIAREGYKSESATIYGEALADATSFAERLILRGVYLHTRLLTRGAAIWATPLLRILSHKN